jgi:hypothetical protein
MGADDMGPLMTGTTRRSVPGCASILDMKPLNLLPPSSLAGEDAERGGVVDDASGFVVDNDVADIVEIGLGCARRTSLCERARPCAGRVLASSR